METLANLAYGLSIAMQPENLVYCAIGALLGTLIGVLPGLGPTATISILLPLTFGISPTGSLIMLAGIYYGAQYGGSTTSILVNLPGEASSVVTCIDGHQMARQGRAGPALATAAVGSLFAGIVGTVLLAIFAPAIAQLALRIGPAEYFSLMVLGLIAAIALSNNSLSRSVSMIFVGVLIGCIGTDINTGKARYTFGSFELGDGLDFLVVAMGIFGIGEIMRNLETDSIRTRLSIPIGRFMPTRADLRRAIPAVLRGTALGSFLGPIPGAGAVISSFSAYALEKKLSKHPEEFGKGAIEGVAGPEAANNACAQTTFVPLLALGVPGGAVTAVMLGALMMHGLVPGPQFMTRNPDIFWGLIASMFIGNIMLVILNLPLVGLWVRLLSTPYRLLFPAILLFCCIGVFSLSNSYLDIYLMLIFGAVGYVFLKLDCEPAPLLLGLILGPLMEENLRRTLLLSRGDPMVFVYRPISAAMLAIAVGLIVLALWPSVAARRKEVLAEASE